MLEWKIDNKYDDYLIREYLQTVHFFSRKILSAIKFDGGNILVNGRSRKVNERLRGGDTLKVLFPPEEKGHFMVPENIPLSIMYEDNDVIIINKPPEIAITPSPIHQSGTIANGLLAHYKQNNIPYTVHVVTRLDRNTSGLLLVAKHRYSHSLLANYQQRNKVKRKYQAVIQGHLDNKMGVIDAPIGRKKSSIIERMVTKAGKHAITHYEVKYESRHHSLVQIELETGRTHQIRVHFSHLDHPIAGDDLYGGSSKFIDRQALHCYEISFTHPITKESMDFSLPIPLDIESVIHV